MSRVNHPIKAGAGGQPVARRDCSRHRRGDAYIRRVGTADPVGAGRASLIARCFNWGDAGIGAADGIGIPMLATGGGPAPSACAVITSAPPHDRRAR